ncbi:MAG: hypothetical protein AABY83_10350 [Pseudomonadota bacterium]
MTHAVLADEACHVIVKKSQLSKTQVDGVERYVIDTALVGDDDCFKPAETGELIKALRKKIQENIELAEAAKANAEKQLTLNQEYRKLIQSHEKTLEKSINTAQGFAENAMKYSNLVQDYDKLTMKFDSLAGKYRDVAITAGANFRLDMGGGVTGDGGAVGLVGMGMHVYRQWGAGVWGVVGRDARSVIGGASYRF